MWKYVGGQAYFHALVGGADGGPLHVHDGGERS